MQNYSNLVLFTGSLIALPTMVWMPYSLTIDIWLVSYCNPQIPYTFVFIKCSLILGLFPQRVQSVHSGWKQCHLCWNCDGCKPISIICKYVNPLSSSMISEHHNDDTMLFSHFGLGILSKNVGQGSYPKSFKKLWFCIFSSHYFTPVLAKSSFL